MYKTNIVYFAGQIVLARTLDREMEKYYWLTIASREKQGSYLFEDYIKVAVTVVDVNDNFPVSDQPSYNISLVIYNMLYYKKRDTILKKLFKNFQ